MKTIRFVNYDKMNLILISLLNYLNVYKNLVTNALLNVNTSVSADAGGKGSSVMRHPQIKVARGRAGHPDYSSASRPTRLSPPAEP